MNYYLKETADEIKALDRNDPEWGQHVACIIKKHTHAQKLGVYTDVFRELKHGPRKPRAFKRHVKWLVKNWLKYKVMSHEDFANRDIRNQIYDMFDWKKSPPLPRRQCPYDDGIQCGSTDDDSCPDCDENPKVLKEKLETKKIV